MKSVLPNSLKRFVIVTFVLIEIIAAIYSYIEYAKNKDRIVTHHQEFNIDKVSLELRLSENKADSWWDFLFFTLVISISGLIGNSLYQKHFRKIQEDFNNFSKLLSKSVKFHTPITLDDNLKYKEFELIKKSLNTVLSEMDETLNYNSLTKLPKKHKFLKDIMDLKNSTELHIIVCYIYFKGYEKIIVNRGFKVADDIILEFSEKIIKLQNNISDSKISKISGNGDFLFSFPCTVTPSYCIDSVSDSLHKAFEECLNDNNENLREQSLGLGFDILKESCNEKSCNESINNAYRAAVLVSEELNKKYFTYSQELREKIQYGVDLEKDLKTALNENELQVFYQGKVGTKDNKLKSAEALVRWNRNGKFENTEVFIKIAEKTDMIIKLEKFVINEVVKTQRALQNKGVFFPISINISAKHLSKAGFLDFLLETIKKYHIKPKYIELEIVERERISEENIKILTNIKNSGFSISIDDFGKDYSSLSYINNLPIDSIKIDKGFVDGLDPKNGKTANENSKAIISGIIKIAKSMNKKTIAEGVETIEQLEILKEIECDELQGYYFHIGASPIDEFLEVYKHML